MTRAVVNVATTPYYQRGQARLIKWLSEHHEPGIGLMSEPAGCPPHSVIPYAFKAFALREAAKRADLLLWADSSILPIRSLEPLWQRIERDGYWFSDNGYSNYEWTADSAYPDLFPGGFTDSENLGMQVFDWEYMRELNRNIKHVVATAFGLNVHSKIGASFLAEYFRLASETFAFCGPWTNSNSSEAPLLGPRCGPCGPPDVRGHRHDQTAASVIAWRLGMQLTAPPNIIAYKGGETEETILSVDGTYV